MGSTSASSSCSAVAASFSNLWSPEMMSITAIHLNGKNYVTWAKSVETYFMGSKQYTYLINDPPKPTESTHVSGWLRMHIFIFDCGIVWSPRLLTHLCLRYCPYQWLIIFVWLLTFIKHISLLVLVILLWKNIGVCEELNICQPFSTDIQVMHRQCENLNVARFLLGLPKSFDPICHQLPGGGCLL